MNKYYGIIVGVCCCFLMLSGCAKTDTGVEVLVDQVKAERAEEAEKAERAEEAEEAERAERAEEAEKAERALTDVELRDFGVNELGHIMVVMYHGIKDNPPYHRTKEDFIKDLTFMYEHGYRLISMSDYLSGHIDVKVGMTPILFTFDDGLPSTFSMLKTEDGLVVNPESAVGILEEFALKHPDFGTDATFYIHGNDRNFHGDGTATERMNWLLDRGYEIGNHSNTHANLKNLNKNQLLEEIGKVDVYVDSVLPGYKMKTISYPFGIRPEEALRPLLRSGEYEGYGFNYVTAFREGPSGPFYPPNHKKFMPFNAPRVRGSEGEVQDLWWFLDHYEKNPNQKYVSDGDPNTIAIPKGKEDNLKEGLAESFKIVVYE